MAKKPGFEALFALARPCENCTFLTDGAIELAPGRLEGIVASLLRDDWTTFSCHKTVHHPVTGGEWSAEGDYTASGREAHCMGAMAYLQKVGRANVPMRIGYATGMLDIEVVRSNAGLVLDELDVSGVAPDE
ncbi:hypothetical protein [Ottowia sp.]|uniref:hypothetical protein n=1 Tax=Ottowia sp. TaxID=1898956 RepID=UPI0025F9C640|nr:hypothetical protein [Ottowia sp.]MBK6616644.1 hypothetical protein [Ottowia sp.]